MIERKTNAKRVSVGCKSHSLLKQITKPEWFLMVEA